MPELVEALTRTLSDGPVSPAWQRLFSLLSAAGAELGQAWELVQSAGDPEQLAALAGLLARHAETHSAWGNELRHWARSANDRSGHANVLHGAAQVHGPSIQARDISGGIHLHQPSPKPRMIPRQLLRVPAHFTDRADDLRALHALRDGRDPTAPQVVVVSGPGGVGKTTLVSKWLRDLEPRFPDGQLYIDLRGFGPGGSPSPEEALSSLLRAVGQSEPPAVLSEQAALWRSLTSGRRIAVMLDNAVSAAQVRVLLPSAPESLVVVTSRHRLTGLVVDGAVSHQLPALGEEAAVELLSRGVGRHRVERERTAAREVVALCSGLPLAVCLAAARLALRPRQPVAAMAEALNRGPGPLRTLRAEGDQRLQTVLDESYGVLEPDAARVYRRLGLLPVTGFDADLVAAVCQVDQGEAQRLLDVLAEANLAEETGADRYRFHDLVRLHADQRGNADEPPAERESAVRRFVGWCLAMATAAEELLSPSHRNLDRDCLLRPRTASFPDQDAALRWLDLHRDSLMGAVRRSAEAGWDDAAWQLVDAMWPLFLRLRPGALWIEAHEIGLAAARRAGHRAGEVRMLTSGAIGLRNAERFQDGLEWLDEALVLARADGDLRDEAQVRNGMGRCLLGLGRPAEAEEHFARALALREQIGYRRGVALTRSCLGEVALAEGRWAQAVSHLAQAHAGLVAEDDTYDAARTRALLGSARVRAGQPDRGMRELLAALRELEQTGSVSWQARTLEMLGQAAAGTGDAGAARRFYEEALRRLEPVSPAGAARLRGRLHDLGGADAPG